MHTRPTLFVAHRKELIRVGLVAMAGELGSRVLGIGSDGAETIEGVVRTGPAVALVDCLLPDDGFAVARRLASAAPRTRVIMLSPGVDENHLARAHAAGAVNCLPKAISLEDFGAAIGMAARGERPVPPAPFAVVAERLDRGAVDRPGDGEDPRPQAAAAHGTARPHPGRGLGGEARPGVRRRIPRRSPPIRRSARASSRVPCPPTRRRGCPPRA